LNELSVCGVPLPQTLHQPRMRSKGAGRLQVMASLYAAPALTAPANVDVELAVNGLARDLDLELGGGGGFGEWAPAVGAGVWQGRLSFVDLVGRRLTVCFGAVIFAGLRPDFLGWAVGWPLAKGAAWRLLARVVSSSWRRRRSFSACMFAEASLKGSAA